METVRHKFRVEIEFDNDLGNSKKFLDSEVWMTRDEYYDLIEKIKKFVNH